MISDTLHIIFGNASHSKKYSQTNAINPRFIVLATQPELIISKMALDIHNIKIVRYPEEIWKPTTFPCEKRVRETESMIKGYQKLGVNVMEKTP